MGAPKQTVVAVTIVKSQSLRVPGKNFRTLGDRPLFRWIVDAVLECSAVDTFVIDTDAVNELKKYELPTDSRLELRRRPEALLGNHVTANALLDAIIPAYPADVYVMVHATSPFVSAVTLRRAIASYNAAVHAGRADSLMAVTRYQSRFYRHDGQAVNHDPSRLQPTQDLEPWFEENSALYVFSGASFRATGSRVGLSPLLFPVPALQAIDIDTLDDWELAQTVAQGLTRAHIPQEASD